MGVCRFLFVRLAVRTSDPRHVADWRRAGMDARASLRRLLLGVCRSLFVRWRCEQVAQDISPAGVVLGWMLEPPHVGCYSIFPLTEGRGT